MTAQEEEDMPAKKMKAKAKRKTAKQPLPFSPPCTPTPRRPKKPAKKK